MTKSENRQMLEKQYVKTNDGDENVINMRTLKASETAQYEIKSHNSSDNKQWGVLLLVVSYVLTIGTAIPVGYCIGVINSPATFIKNWCNETLIARYDWKLSDSQLELLWSSVVSIFLASAALGSLTGASAANRLGRKNCLLLTGLLLLVSGIFFICCRWISSVELLLLGRFIVGLAAGLTTSVLPMYLTEIAPLALRGTAGVFCAVGVTGGVVVGQVFSLGQIFGTAELWHYALGAYIVLVIVCFLPAFYFPESPKYLLIVCGDRQAALQALKRLRAGQDSDILEQEIYDMDNEAKNNTTSVSFMQVLSDRKMLLPLIITCAYQAGQQLSGINAIFYYSVSIFQTAGLSYENAQWANLGAGCLNLATSFLSSWLMSRYNRRPLMMLSCAMCSLFLLGVSFFLNYIESYSWFALVCICCIMAYIFFFQFGLGPIPYFIGTELFQIQPRPVAMSMGSLSSWAGNFMVGMCFPILQKTWGALVFLPFSLTCALLFALTKFYLPETRGRETAEIAALVSNGFKSKVMK